MVDSVELYDLSFSTSEPVLTLLPNNDSLEESKDMVGTFLALMTAFCNYRIVSYEQGYADALEDLEEDNESNIDLI